MAGEVAVSFTGNLTADPELRQAGQAQVASFSVAVTPRMFKDGQWADGETTFYRCQAWRDLAEHLAASAGKGTRVTVQGTISSRTYEKDGQRQTIWEVRADEVGLSLRYAAGRLTQANTSGGNYQQQGVDQYAQQGGYGVANNGYPQGMGPGQQQPQQGQWGQQQAQQQNWTQQAPAQQGQWGGPQNGAQQPAADPRWGNDSPPF